MYVYVHSFVADFTVNLSVLYVHTYVCTGTLIHKVIWVAIISPLVYVICAHFL